MNDEIKEMLDNIKDIVEGYTKICNYNQDEVIYDEINYSPKQWYLLLDYITNLQQDLKNYVDIVLYQRKTIDNLQQENKYLNNELNNMTDYAKDLQQENERLKEANVYCNRTDCVGRIKDSRKYASVYQEKEDYKTRCEKAIEYINKNKKVVSKYEAKDTRLPLGTFMWGVDNLLNILQNGSEKDDKN